MSGARAKTRRSRGTAVARWTFCFALALMLHVAGAMAIVASWNDDPDTIASGPVVLVALSPVVVAPETQPIEVPPGLKQTEAPSAPEQSDQKVELSNEPDPAPRQPAEKFELKPLPAPEPEVAALPPPRPNIEPENEQAKPTRQTGRTTAPSAATRHAARTAAPLPGARTQDSSALPNWRSMLVARLQRHKRYPPEARSRGESGVAHLSFSIDRNGGVHDARIVRSSGSATLDRETLAMVRRAAPLPAPPSGVGGARIAIVVPISYSIR